MIPSVILLRAKGLKLAWNFTDVVCGRSLKDSIKRLALYDKNDKWHYKLLQCDIDLMLRRWISVYLRKLIRKKRNLKLFSLDNHTSEIFMIRNLSWHCLLNILQETYIKLWKWAFIFPHQETWKSARLTYKKFILGGNVL